MRCARCSGFHANANRQTEMMKERKCREKNKHIPQPHSASLIFERKCILKVHWTDERDSEKQISEAKISHRNSTATRKITEFGMWTSENVQNAGIHIKIARIIAMAHRFFYQSLCCTHAIENGTIQTNEMKEHKMCLKCAWKTQKQT